MLPKTADHLLQENLVAVGKFGGTYMLADSKGNATRRFVYDQSLRRSKESDEAGAIAMSVE